MIDKHRPRVVALLRERHPKPLCVKCIAVGLDIRPSAAHRAATLVEGAPGFVREYAICGVCGERRLTVRATSASS